MSYQYILIYRDKASNDNDKVYPWLLKLFNSKDELVDVVGCNTTAKAKRVLKSWGSNGRVDWSMIDTCMQRWF